MSASQGSPCPSFPKSKPSVAVWPLCSKARGITGEILHVDAGYHVVGMKVPTAPDITLDKADEDAKRLAAAGDDALAWPAFANDGDHDRVWGASDEQSDKALSPR
eukprot:gene31633-42179_t